MNNKIANSIRKEKWGVKTTTDKIRRLLNDQNKETEVGEIIDVWTKEKDMIEKLVKDA